MAIGCSKRTTTSVPIHRGGIASIDVESGFVVDRLSASIDFGSYKGRSLNIMFPAIGSPLAAGLADGRLSSSPWVAEEYGGYGYRVHYGDGVFTAVPDGLEFVIIGDGSWSRTRVRELLSSIKRESASSEP
jgi:hypothetical protein